MSSEGAGYFLRPLSAQERQQVVEVAARHFEDNNRTLEVRELAELLTSAGHDDPALIEIVTELHPYSDEAGAFFESFLQARGLPQTARDAYIDLTANICRRALRGEISPRAATDSVWSLYYGALEAGLNLKDLAYFDDEYMAESEPSEQIDFAVLREARRFLDEHSLAL